MEGLALRRCTATARLPVDSRQPLPGSLAAGTASSNRWGQDERVGEQLRTPLMAAVWMRACAATANSITP
eukprot:2421550-Alexandrium_andersonii.AAC.1